MCQLTVILDYSIVDGGGYLYGGTRKLPYFLNAIRKNCIYFGGLRKTGILSDTEILYFEGQNTAQLQH